MAFNWVSASLVSAAILAIVHVVDSHLISKRLPSVQSYLLVLGFIILIVSAVIIILFPLPGSVQSSVVAHLANLTGLGVILGTGFVILCTLLRSGIRAVIS